MERDCEQEYRQTEALWKEASCWEELVELSRRFIRGELRFTPGHLAPLCDESRPLVSGFLKLHDFGIITINSQPESYEICQITSGQWSTGQQRPYLECVVPSRHPSISMGKLNNIIERLFDDPDLMVAVWSHHYKYPTAARSRQGVAPKLAPGEHITDLEKSVHTFRFNGPREHHIVTRYKEAPTRAELEDAAWELSTTWGSFADTQNLEYLQDDPFVVVYCSNDEYARIFDDVRPVQITIAARPWSAGIDLQDRLLAYCDQAGMSRCFAEE
ncbi:hypothetical protein K491DRAFT_724388 [Lophiostoma macrostomum CBS 122681]|uniref:DUF6919 domain-containing protein n=1 Tax=Lophiostoma macrostomum CBS 122681 TaxID=1314788 RepID=A0A6A6TTX6_9PLEO|nr:hypothetical protein K491DRAFT_724388 [Lophiostoma macrostomum CBS 122681]